MRPDPAARRDATRRPDESPAWYHDWRDQLFVHWEVPAAVLRPLLPAGLELDTFEERAFVGLVPFAMGGIRGRWLPPIPGSIAFPETNVRTYVHHRGRDPGVFFLSLDGTSPLAVWLARRMGLRYHLASIRHAREPDGFRLRLTRRWPPPRPATLDVAWEPGAELGAAEVGSLEHFLVERYVLYASPDGRLRRGRVHHTPYPLRRARITRLEGNLVSLVTGLSEQESPVSVLASPGVSVESFAIRDVPSDPGGATRDLRT
jgi:hypothetical protein